MKSMYFCIFVQKVLVRDEYFSRMRCGVVLIFCGLDFAKKSVISGWAWLIVYQF